MEAIRTKAKTLPRRPGVYLMKGAQGRVLYIGKARDLRQRVSSYFQPSRPSHPRTDVLVRSVRDVDFIVTDSELEALILEQSMIKEYRPRYNVNLKDDKRYPYVRLTVGHPVPRLEITRRLGDKRSRYYGPYADVASLRHTVKRLRRAFPLRVCSDARVQQHDQRECLDYFIGSCSAPCTHRVSESDYGEIVRAFTRFLGGQSREVVEELRDEMNRAAAAREYERAAVFRDRLRATESVLRRQNVAKPGGEDVDVVGIAADDDSALGLVLRVRAGTLIGKEERVLARTGGSPLDEILALFVMQFYLGDRTLPTRLALPVEPSERELFEAWLGRRAGHRVRVAVPRRGPLAGLVRVAARNAALSLRERTASAAGGAPAAPELDELRRALDLRSVPVKIEAIDVSTIQGQDTVASVVVFENGAPRRSLYRRYRIRRVAGADDFASIQEVVDRRVSRALAEGAALPDLVLIDGGAGQLSAARRALAKYDIADLPIIGLAKREERIVFPDSRGTLRLSRRSEGLKLLQRIRNEAHRVAVQYHRRLRSRRLKGSRLDEIEGIGPARKAMLLRSFGSIAGIREAGLERLARLPGIGRAMAARILAALDSGEGRA
jgi:excinuclease ABC subunit C